MNDKLQKIVVLCVLVVLLIVIYLVSSAGGDKRAATASFEECVAAGYPVMESHPRQCQDAEGNSFVEVLEEDETSDQPEEKSLLDEEVGMTTTQSVDSESVGESTESETEVDIDASTDSHFCECSNGTLQMCPGGTGTSADDCAACCSTYQGGEDGSGTE